MASAQSRGTIHPFFRHHILSTFRAAASLTGKSRQLMPNTYSVEHRQWYHPLKCSIYEINLPTVH